MNKGYKTTEFWVTTLTQVATVGASLAGVLPPKVAAVVGVAAQIAYVISRGISKFNLPTS